METIRVLAVDHDFYTRYALSDMARKIRTFSCIHKDNNKPPSIRLLCNDSKSEYFWIHDSSNYKINKDLKNMEFGVRLPNFTHQKVKVLN